MARDLVVSQQSPLSRVAGSKIWPSIGRQDPPHRATIVRGRERVAAFQPALVALSRRTGQIGAMDWIDHFLYSPNALKKDPHLVLIRDASLSWRGETDPLLGAVLMYEYRLAGLPTGIFATDDIYGSRTVLAPPSHGCAIGRAAATELMRRNAAAVFISVNQAPSHGPDTQPTAAAGIRVAQRTRWTPAYLQLSHSFDSLLARLGPRTRRNLRYYPRRAAAEMGAYFVPNAQPNLQEFLELNRASTHPLSHADAVWRHRLLDQSRMELTTLYAGMRAANGSWLSLIWGKRFNGVTEVDWQINRNGDSHHSFSIAMRALLMEHEIGLGTNALRFVGGTQHSLSASCSAEPITDILAIRQGSARSWTLRRFAKQILPDANFLRGALQDDNMAA